MSEVEKWLVNWLATNGGNDEVEIEKSMNESYFAAGFIDSFQFINMIYDIEDEFDIEFDNEQFEDRSFSTVSGMAKIIERMCEK